MLRLKFDEALKVRWWHPERSCSTLPLSPAVGWHKCCGGCVHDRAAGLGESGQLVLVQGTAWWEQAAGNVGRAGHGFLVVVPTDV